MRLRATLELMDKHWLGTPEVAKSPSGGSICQPLEGSSTASRVFKRTAFLAVRKELKVYDAASNGAKYLHPYYWGAFVMVGE